LRPSAPDAADYFLSQRLRIGGPEEALAWFQDRLGGLPSIEWLEGKMVLGDRRHLSAPGEEFWKIALTQADDHLEPIALGSRVGGGTMVLAAAFPAAIVHQARDLRPERFDVIARSRIVALAGKDVFKLVKDQDRHEVFLVPGNPPWLLHLEIIPEGLAFSKGSSVNLSFYENAVDFVAHLLDWMHRAGALQAQINGLETLAIKQRLQTGPQ
jgi:hypothetical protein